MRLYREMIGEELPDDFLECMGGPTWRDHRELEP